MGDQQKIMKWRPQISVCISEQAKNSTYRKAGRDCARKILDNFFTRDIQTERDYELFWNCAQLLNMRIEKVSSVPVNSFITTNVAFQLCNWAVQGSNAVQPVIQIAVYLISSSLQMMQKYFNILPGITFTCTITCV